MRMVFRIVICSARHCRDDPAAYAQSKMTAKDGVSNTIDYNRKKHDTVQQIYALLFAALP